MMDHFNIGVFYVTPEFRQSFFKRVLSEVDNEEILFFTTHDIVLKGGITYRFYRGNESCCGVRIDRAYIEPAVSDDWVQTVIRPLFSKPQIIYCNRENALELEN